MIFYCPDCWKELPGDLPACPKCGAILSSWGEKKYSAKLLKALRHPEPETQRRAIYLLGEKKVREAIDPLAELLRQIPNSFLKGEIVEAIGKIGGDAAFSLLIEALRHPSFMVRAEAAKALSKFPGNDIVKHELKRALKDPSSYVREIGKQALEHLQSASEAKDE